MSGSRRLLRRPLLPATWGPRHLRAGPRPRVESRTLRHSPQRHGSRRSSTATGCRRRAGAPPLGPAQTEWTPRAALAEWTRSRGTAGAARPREKAPTQGRRRGCRARRHDERDATHDQDVGRRQGGVGAAPPPQGAARLFPPARPRVHTRRYPGPAVSPGAGPSASPSSCSATATGAVGSRWGPSGRARPGDSSCGGRWRPRGFSSSSAAAD